MSATSATTADVVIIGAGFGGLFTAQALQKKRPGLSITLIEPRSRFLFQPLLYELLSDELQLWEVAPANADLFNSSGLCWLQDSVEHIDRGQHSLTTKAGRKLSWSYLVIATGSETNDFGIPGVRDYAQGFSTLADVQRLRLWVKDQRQQRSSQAAIAIVGAGPTGVELACKLADLLDGAARVHLIEAGDGILPSASAFNRERAEAALQQRDIVLHLNSSVAALHSDHVHLHGQAKIKHNGVIWTAGSRPKWPKIAPAPDQERGRLAINSDLRLKGSTDVFALGDAAICKDNPWPATAQVAMQQGSAVAEAIPALMQATEPDPFAFNNLGEMLSLGIGNATVTGMGLTLAGPLAFKLRRATYLTRLPGLSLGLRSAGAWLMPR